MSKPASRSGIVLIEFLLVALVLLLIVFMGAQFGLMISQLQFTAEGARIAAREASTKPGALVIPGNATAVYVDPAVFDERFTVIDLGAFRSPVNGALLAVQTLDSQFQVLPAGNRALRGHMLVDSLSVPGRNLLRFQGVLLRNAAAAPFDLIVRVPDVAGSNAQLRRIINPPLANPADGLVQIECWQWFKYTTWLLPGGAVLPTPLAYSNLPPGYSVLVLDVEPASRAGTRLVSYGVARKEIQ